MTLLAKIRRETGLQAWLALALLLAAATGAQAQKAAPKPAAKAAVKAAPKAATATPPIFGGEKLTYPGGVTARGDVVYLTLPGFRPLTLDLYMPSGKTASVPAILYIHGGGWNSGNARASRAFADLPSVLASTAARGYVVASLNYRLSGEARFPAALQDVKSALRWLRAHAGDTGIDATRIAVWGEDAGGQLAALAGTSCGVQTFEPSLDAGAKIALPSDCAQAVVDWYGPTDFATLESDAGHTPAADAATQLGAYLGCEPSQCAPGIVHAASALSYVGNMSPPFLIAQGADDSLVSPKQSQKLYDALKAAGAPAELALYPGVGHDFAPADSDTAKQALARTMDFMARTFPPAPIATKAAVRTPAKPPAPAKAKPASSH